MQLAPAQGLAAPQVQLGAVEYGDAAIKLLDTVGGGIEAGAEGAKYPLVSTYTFGVDIKF